ncbi:MAG: hypothetical protein MHMPM18_000183 [Marteilia pararefringens]
MQAKSVSCTSHEVLQKLSANCRNELMQFCTKWLRIVLDRWCGRKYDAFTSSTLVRCVEEYFCDNFLPTDDSKHELGIVKCSRKTKITEVQPFNFSYKARIKIDGEENNQNNPINNKREELEEKRGSSTVNIINLTRDEIERKHGTEVNSEKRRVLLQRVSDLWRPACAEKKAAGKAHSQRHEDKPNLIEKRESRYTSISAATNGDKIDRENTRKCVMQTHKAQPKHNTSSLLRTKASFVKQSLGLRQNLLGVLGLAHHGGGASTNLNWRLEVAGRKKSAESEMEKKIAERRSDAAERLGRVRQWRQSYSDQIRQARDKDSKIFKDRRVEINDNIKTKKNGKFIKKSEPKDKEKIIRDKQLRGS